MSESKQTYDTTLESRLLQRYPDAFLDDNGHVVEKRTGVQYQNGQAMDKTYIHDLSVLFRNGPRETGHVDHLVIEAELADERGEVGNPAEPIDIKTERAAREQIAEKGLTPAWEYDE